MQSTVFTIFLLFVVMTEITSILLSSLSSSTSYTSVPNVILCTDFDNTITTKDSIEFIAEAALNSPLRNRLEKERNRKLWENVCKTYELETNSVISNYHLDSKVEEENLSNNAINLFLENDLIDFLTEYHLAEGISIRMILENNILFGISMKDIEGIANLLVENYIDPHFKPQKFSLVKHLNIISLNWSAVMIRLVLNRISSMNNNSIERKDVSIHANDLIFKKNTNHSNGKLNVDVQTAVHKLKRIQYIRSMSQKQSSSSDAELIVYVGDSISDLLALCEADVGFVINTNSKTFHNAVKKFGISLKPLPLRVTDASSSFIMQLAEKSVTEKSQGKRLLYQVDNWELLSSLF